MTQVDAEEWRPVVGHEGSYEVSSLGRVRSLDRVLTHSNGFQQRVAGNLRTPGTDGRYTVFYTPNGPVYLHHAILEAFVGPRPEGCVGRHLDDNPRNNRLDNLEWGTRSQNTLDMVKNGNHNNARKTRCKNGHELSEENVYVTVRGSRQCRKCRLEYQRKWHKARKEKVAL